MQIPTEGLEHIWRLLEADELARCSSTCGDWRRMLDSPDVWKVTYQRDFGAHQVHSAGVLHPVPGISGCEWRTRHAQRCRAHRNKQQGRCIRRCLHFKHGDGGLLSEDTFFVTAIATDAWLLVTGDSSGKVCDWDMRNRKLTARNCYLGFTGPVVTVCVDIVLG